MRISRTLLDEIDEKSDAIGNNPDYFLRRSKLVRTLFRNLARRQSYWLENPEERREMARNFRLKGFREIRKSSKLGIKRINDAWHYLSEVSHDSEKGDLDYVTPSSIVGVGTRILPNHGYRSERVSLGLKEYAPPNPLKVPELIDEFCDEIKEDLHPVEAGIYAHLSIAGIQPFLDGNKRTGRVFQDVILTHNDLPPALIPYGERSVYIDLLASGLAGKRDGDLNKQRPFFNYVGGKVNAALDFIMFKCR